jgi:polysaccharide biosynthesis protein PslG
MRRLLVLVVLALTAALAVAALLVVPRQDGRQVEAGEEAVALPQSPMPGRLLIGFQDDASLRWAEDRAQVLDSARESSAAVIRTIVGWEQTAPYRPADPADPFEPSYRLDDVDELVRGAQERGIELLVSIWGTPAWANGGKGPNRPPTDAGDLEAFAQALADRYSGRHAGFPAVRLFSAWNEPNLEQFLAPQFDAEGRSLAPALYAPIARAIHSGVKSGNPGALVAIGETSPRGRDLPSPGTVQDSHSPARFARLLSEERPRVPFDAWAQHPYPTRANVAPDSPVRWPRVGLGNLERFGASIDAWFGRLETPLWVTEYAHETRPGNSVGIEPELQAIFAAEALEAAARNPRVRLFVWFTLRDSPENPWQSGILDEDGTPKPAFASFSARARELDGRSPVLPADAMLARIPVLELARYTVRGEPIEVRLESRKPFSVPLRADGWLDVPLDGVPRTTSSVRAIDAHGHSVERTLQFEDDAGELN